MVSRVNKFVENIAGRAITVNTARTTIINKSGKAGSWDVHGSKSKTIDNFYGKEF
jgi:hypothetical protein